MSQNSFKVTLPVMKTRSWWVIAIVAPVWVFASFLLAQFCVEGLLWVLSRLSVPLSSINQVVATTVLAALIYVMSLLIVIGIPWIGLKSRTTRADLGIAKPPQPSDLLLAPIGAIVYFILSFILVSVATMFVTGFNAGQAQDTGFNALTENYQFVLAFVTLVLIAPVAEEILFRGYLLGKLIKTVPVWLAVLITSFLFGFIHLGFTDHPAWNLALDTFALSIVLCMLRLKTKSVWASMLVHMMKNGIAFYILFINPLLLHTLGG
jgi:membrane protease YdiL (CAAX protease family)